MDKKIKNTFQPAHRGDLQTKKHIYHTDTTRVQKH